MSKQTEFQNVFDCLHGILIPYAEELSMDTNKSGKIYMNTRFDMPNGKQMFFGAAMIGKSYVSYHLMPVYIYPGLLNDISSGLKQRMQGKSCFNLKAVNLGLFKELKELTKYGYARYKKEEHI